MMKIKKRIKKLEAAVANLSAAVLNGYTKHTETTVIDGVTTTVETFEPVSNVCELRAVDDGS